MRIAPQNISQTTKARTRAAFTARIAVKPIHRAIVRWGRLISLLPGFCRREHPGRVSSGPIAVEIDPPVGPMSGDRIADAAIVTGEVGSETGTPDGSTSQGV